MTHSRAIRQPLYWGWIVAVSGFFCLFVTYSFAEQVSGAFFLPMITDLGWSHGLYVTAGALGYLAAGIAALVVGPMLDRIGPRPIMIVGAVLIGVGFALCSTVTHFWQFLLYRGFLAQVGMTLCGGMVVNVTVSRWFTNRRAVVLSWVSAGASLGVLITPYAMIHAVDAVGWRNGWLILGAWGFCFTFPAALLMRRSPEDEGLHAHSEMSGGSDEAISYTRADAIRSPVFWRITVAFGCALAAFVAVLSHIVPLLSDLGFSRQSAAMLISANALGALVTKPAWGWIFHRFALPTIGQVVMIGIALDLAVLATLDQPHFTTALLVMIAFGALIGSLLPLSEAIWPTYFGRLHLGAVSSVSRPVNLVFVATALVGLGVYRDVAGSYGIGLLVFASTFVFAALALRLPPPSAPLRTAPGTAPLAGIGGEA